MKKIISILLALVLLVCLAACELPSADNKTPGSPTTPDANNPAITPTTPPTTNNPTTEPDLSKYQEGTLVFCTNGVAYLIGIRGSLKAEYTGWETRDYGNLHHPWGGEKDDITAVVFEDGVTAISTRNWFHGCENLKTVTIGYGLTHIDQSAFSFSKNLTSVTLPGSVIEIGDSAFTFCESLTSINIPNSVTSIGRDAFRICKSLTSITFDGTVAQWHAITKGDGWNFGVPATEVICSDGVVTL